MDTVGGRTAQVLKSPAQAVRRLRLSVRPRGPVDCNPAPPAAAPSAVPRAWTVAGVAPNRSGCSPIASTAEAGGSSTDLGTRSMSPILGGDRTLGVKPEGEAVGPSEPGGASRDLHEQALAAHGRLVAGDRVASEDLTRLLLRPLVSRLERRWRRWQHTDVLYDAAVDAVIEYLSAPERYDPSRRSLLTWLELAAHRDLTNMYKSAKQRAAIETVPFSSMGDPERPPTELPAAVEPLGMSRVAPDSASMGAEADRFVSSAT